MNGDAANNLMHPDNLMLANLRAEQLYTPSADGRSERSYVWRHFRIFNDKCAETGETRQFRVCLHCFKKHRYNPNGGTSNMNRHLRSAHGIHAQSSTSGSGLSSLVQRVSQHNPLPPRLPQHCVNNRLLEGLRVVVTGASRGIGRDICLQLARHGADVIALSRDRVQLQSLQAAVGAFGGRSWAFECDLQDPDDVRRTLPRIFHNTPVDCLVNNAGITVLAPFLQMTEHKFRRVMNTNVLGVFRISQMVARHMVERVIHYRREQRESKAEDSKPSKSVISKAIQAVGNGTALPPPPASTSTSTSTASTNSSAGAAVPDLVPTTNGVSVPVMVSEGQVIAKPVAVASEAPQPVTSQTEPHPTVRTPPPPSSHEDPPGMNTALQLLTGKVRPRDEAHIPTGQPLTKRVQNVDSRQGTEGVGPPPNAAGDAVPEAKQPPVASGGNGTHRSFRENWTPNFSIINISSVASKRALKDHIAYCTSKGALDQMTRMMALELGSYGIRVNSINPTVVMTDMGRKTWSDPVKAEPIRSRIPLRRFAEPREVSQAVVFLASRLASMLNGAFIPVDGGFWIS